VATRARPEKQAIELARNEIPGKKRPAELSAPTPARLHRASIVTSFAQLAAEQAERTPAGECREGSAICGRRDRIGIYHQQKRSYRCFCPAVYAGSKSEVAVLCDQACLGAVGDEITCGVRRAVVYDDDLGIGQIRRNRIQCGRDHLGGVIGDDYDGHENGGTVAVRDC
jgi:hypothetical protein